VRYKEQPGNSKRLKTRHFDLEDWADFARGVASRERGEAMRQHLQEGCRPCHETLELWRSVSQAAFREATYLPPEGAVRIARAQFGLAQSAPEFASALRTTQVIFDSFRQPALAGVRSAGKKPRQIVYQVGEYYVDLRMEREGGPGKVICIGQLRDSNDPDKRMDETPVLLLRGQDRIGRTTTNPFGEFRLQFDRQENLWLAIGIQGEAGIVVPLGRALEEEPVEARR
jgi:hypothetical protein